VRNESTIYITGHRRIPGFAITHKPRENGFESLLLKSSREFERYNRQDISAFFEEKKTGRVVLI
jgi:hypothetical protein